MVCKMYFKDLKIYLKKTNWQKMCPSWLKKRGWGLWRHHFFFTNCLGLRRPKMWNEITEEQWQQNYFWINKNAFNSNEVKLKFCKKSVRSFMCVISYKMVSYYKTYVRIWRIKRNLKSVRNIKTRKGIKLTDLYVFIIFKKHVMVWVSSDPRCSERLKRRVEKRLKGDKIQNFALSIFN